MTNKELGNVLHGIGKEVLLWPKQEQIPVGLGAGIAVCEFIVWLRNNNQLNYEYANEELKELITYMGKQCCASQEVQDVTLRRLGIEKAATN